ncbi:GFA family protein [Shewanella cyperi]|nr:GFA family protein [Shewanella cyperi]
MNMTAKDTQGKCLCGAVRFEMAFPSKWVAHCHCSLCQRAHGAAFVTWVGVEESQVSIEDPEGQLCWFASSAPASRGFCRRCGSSLFFRSSRWPGELHITRANFTGPLDREPQAHAFYDSHVDWFLVQDELPKMPQPN